jgi:glucose/arabinose dehydrogenase
MRPRRLLAALAATLLAPVAPAHAATDPRTVRATFAKVWGGLAEPVAMAFVPGETSRVFVVERPGRVRVIRNGVVRATPFLDITSKVSTAGEGGLLGLAFRPDYRTSGYFYVAWTDANMTLHVDRHHAAPASDVAERTGARVLLVPHPGHTNHNGGQLAFGPGGLLFVGTGDGGGSGDPGGNAQNARSLLGKVLRINVTRYAAGTTYSIPADNPYATATTGARREIYALGLRNPWRFSFDRADASMYLADVGQGAREEVDRLARPGLNLGWDCREGTLNTSPTGSPVYGGSYCRTLYTPPLWEYDHSLGCAVVGGYVYRGSRYATLLAGTYVYGDYCSGRVWGLGRDSGGARVNGELGVLGQQILAFGEAPNGELYVLAADGGIYRVAAARR